MEVPWFVEKGLSPEKARALMKTRREHMLSDKQWREFLQRKATGNLRVSGGNVSLRCPRCNRRLRHFYIVRDKKILEQAKKNSKVHGLISGYSCTVCGATYYRQEIERGVQPSPYEGMCVRSSYCRYWRECERNGVKFLFPESVSKGVLPKGPHEV